jgi:hypothetical protein
MRCLSLLSNGHEGDRKGVSLKPSVRNRAMCVSNRHEGDRKGLHPASTPLPPLQRLRALSLSGIKRDAVRPLAIIRLYPAYALTLFPALLR